MSEWWTYRPEDFLLFSPRVYWRMFELHNAALWPLQLLMLTAGVVIILLVAWRPRDHRRAKRRRSSNGYRRAKRRRSSNGYGRWIAFILAVIWAFVGWSFLWSRYTTINWAAAYAALAFAFESLLLLVAGALPDGLTFDRRGRAAWTGYLLAAFAIAGQPLLAPLQGRAWASSEIFGIAPDPTAIGTLGLLLLARGRLLLLLVPIPLLWCLLSGMALWTMGAPEAAAAFAAAMLVLTALFATIAHRRD